MQLPAEFTATVDVEMKVGDRQETITVTGEAPTVDVRSAVVITRLDREVLDQIPTGQNIWEMAQLIPSINLFNVRSPECRHRSADRRGRPRRTCRCAA